MTDIEKIFTYQINWKSHGYHTGSHRGTHIGLGFDFRGNSPLLEYPDPRRVDIRQTINDLTDQVHVRVFNQKNATPVYALCDLSASMRFKGKQKKIALAAEIVASIAYSVQEAGDAFGFIGFSQVISEDWIIKPTIKQTDVDQLIERLANFQPTSSGINGLFDINQHMNKKRGLIFIISDFHFSLKTLNAVLPMLANHHVVPVVLWDENEYENLPNFGFSTFIDPETGAQRTLFFRKALRDRFRKMFFERKKQLSEVFAQYEMPPCFIDKGFKPKVFSEYFHQFSVA